MEFNVNVTRADPYKNFRFHVFFGESKDPVAGVSKVGPLKRSTSPIEHNDGGDLSSSRKSPGRTKYDAISLERGVTHDKTFEAWARQVYDYTLGAPQIALANFRREIRIVLLNEAGVPVKGYLIHRCWVSEYQAMANLDSTANAVLIESIKIENEGWEPDPSIVEPKET